MHCITDLFSGVHGHFHHAYQRPWVAIDDLVVEQSAKIVGSFLFSADVCVNSFLLGAAKKEEVAVLNTLTANLHFLLVSFYRPTATRYKILIEDKAFPSDTVIFRITGSYS
jgi:kynureninase